MAKEWGILNIDKERMNASLILNEPDSDDESSLSKDYIISYLKENGIKVGIKEEAVEMLVEHAPYNQEVVVAQGKPAVNGKDGCFKYLVPLEDSKEKPVVNGDGSVDYINSLKLAMVEEGQVFAVYEPPTPGEFGYTIFSEMIKPVPGKDLRVLKGKGFTVSEDKKEYSANLSGRIYKENDRIIIENIYVVNGELGIEHGNINFNGDVEIRGDVRSGLSIVSGGNIFIHGHVGNCVLKAKGNITIQKGVQGKSGCEIVAGGDVAGSFMERCKITCENNVYADSLLGCEVYAKGQVIVMSKTGQIVGGMIHGLQGITAKNIGNEAFVKTNLRFMEEMEFRNTYNKNREEIAKLRQKIEVFESKLKEIDSIEGATRTKETEALRMKIVRAKIVCAGTLNELEEENKKLLELCRNAERNGKVIVKNIAYPGAIVGIYNNFNVVQQAVKEVQFRFRLGKIEIEPLEDEKK